MKVVDLREKIMSENDLNEYLKSLELIHPKELKMILRRNLELVEFEFPNDDDRFIAPEDRKTPRQKAKKYFIKGTRAYLVLDRKTRKTFDRLVREERDRQRRLGIIPVDKRWLDIDV